MNVAENKVVSFEYTLKNDNGEVLDTSEGREPLTFIHGKGAIIPGLEKALEGKEEGESFSISLKPEEGYGQYDEKLVFDIPKSQFKDMENIQQGMQVQAQMQNGQTQILTVKDIGDADVTLDANHPLAGEELHFDVDVQAVREATEEEIEHGHVHGEEEEEESNQ